MNAGVKSGTTTRVRDPSYLDKGYVPNGVKQCQKKHTPRPQNIMKALPSSIETQLTVTVAETTSKGFNIPHKRQNNPREPIKARKMRTNVPG